MQQGWKQEELSNRSDLSPQVISSAELGKKALRPENLIKLCRALDVSVDYILTGEITEKDLGPLWDKLKKLKASQIKSVEALVDHYF